MNYGTLIRDAWTSTLRARVLWTFGLLAGATGASLGIGRVSWPSNVGADQLAAQLPTLTAQMPVLTSLASIALAAAAAGLVLLTVSVLARAALTHATLELERGDQTSVPGMLRAGVRWFWRFLSLLALLGVLAAGVLGLVLVAALNF